LFVLLMKYVVKVIVLYYIVYDKILPAICCQLECHQLFCNYLWRSTLQRDSGESLWCCQ